MERFAKVTNFFKDAFLGQNEIIPTPDNSDGTIAPDINALMESFSKDLRESNNDGFEVIYKVISMNIHSFLRLLFSGRF